MILEFFKQYPFWGIVIKIVVMLYLFAIPLGALLTYFERKWSSLIQDRVGPNRANIGFLKLYGVFHVIADGIKSIFKEDFYTQGTDKILFTIAPFFIFFSSLVMFAIIPIAAPIDGVHFQIADTNTGILAILALTSFGVYGAVFGGWSTNNKFAYLGSIRAAAQMISYEVFLGLSLVGLLLVFNTLQVSEIVKIQNTYWLNNWIPKWGIFLQPMGFILFFVALIAETKRPPFDAPEGESELVAGYFIEYSGMRFASFFLAEYIAIVGVSCLMTTFFLGSYHVPWLHSDGFHFGNLFFLPIPQWFIFILQVFSFTAKVFSLCWFQIMIRWTVPKFRFDQTMSLGWKKLMPLALLNTFVTSIIVLLFQ